MSEKENKKMKNKKGNKHLDEEKFLDNKKDNNKKENSKKENNKNNNSEELKSTKEDDLNSKEDSSSKEEKSSNKISKRAKKIIIIITSIILVILIGIICYFCRFNFIAAAKVDGNRTVTEQQVIDYINTSVVADGEQLTPEGYASFYRIKQLDASSCRDQTLDSLINREVLNKLCDDHEIKVEAKDVEVKYAEEESSYKETLANNQKNNTNSMKNQSFESYLKQQGSNKDKYKSDIKVTMQSRLLIQKMIETNELYNAAENFYKQEPMVNEMNGVKGFYPLTFSNKEAAEKYKNKLNNGEMTIDAALKEQQEQTGSNDKMANFEEFTFSDTVDTKILNKIKEIPVHQADIYEEASSSEETVYYVFYVAHQVECPAPFTTFSTITDQEVVHNLITFYAMRGDAMVTIINDTKNNIAIEKFDMDPTVPYNVDVNYGK